METKTYEEAMDMFDAEFDLQHGEVKIGTLTFSPSRVFRLCDNDGYRLSVHAYADAMDVEVV